MKTMQETYKGIGFCLLIAIPAFLLGKQFEVIGGPVFAILIGMCLALLVKESGSLQAGIKFTSKKILQYAVILLGFGMNLTDILVKGRQSLPIILATISTSLVISFILYKVMHIPARISTLVGVGSSICGGFRHCGNGSGDRCGRRGDRPVHLGHLPVQCGGRPPVPHPGRPAGSRKRGLRTLCRHGGE